MDKFETLLETALAELDYEAAVAIVRDRDRWLLGLAKGTGDDRNHKWVMPGGHIKRGETPAAAAVRECREETGIHCKVIGELIKLRRKPKVAFLPCRVTSSGQQPKQNHEFALVGWFREQDLGALKLYDNVRELIRRARSCN